MHDLSGFGCYAKDVCDKCGQLSDQCITHAPPVSLGNGARGNAAVMLLKRPVIRKGGRPRKYKTNAERQRVYRSRLGVTKPTANPCASGGTGALAKRLNGA